MPLLRLFALTAFASLWCLALLAVRYYVSGQSAFVFMLWNLFLAAIPLGLSVLLQGFRHPLLGLPIVAGWLLFFPNAPYILTDLLHLRQRGTVPLWYDLLMLLSFALIALWMGFQSLRLVQDWVMRHSSALLGWAVAVGSLILSGFGIYLGRFLRWNSWDLMTRPHALLEDITQRLLDPLAHGKTWMVTLGYGGLLIIGYLFWTATHATPNVSVSRSGK